LRAAWENTLAAHPQLLVSFNESEDGAVSQRPGAWPSPPLEVVDLRDRGEMASRAQVRAWARDEAARPFDLRGEGLIRTRAWLLSDGSVQLMLTAHEILLDGWGANTLVREVADRYAGKAPPAEDGLVGFRRYITWERAHLESEMADAARNRWADVVGGELPPFAFPRDRPPPATPSGLSCKSRTNGMNLGC